MRTAQDIILKPIITEESMMGIMTKKYTFKVAKDANKIEIAKAVEAVFPGTKVAKVNTMNVLGKVKRMGRNEGKASSGYARGLHSILEEGNRYSYRRFKGN